MRLRRKHQDNDRDGQPRPGQTRRVRKLSDDIDEAGELRRLARNADLVAVQVERMCRRTVAGLWFFLALGLCFTTEGVHRFLAGDAPQSDPLWWAAWTVEPMFAGLLVVVLNFEAAILAHDVEPDHFWWTRLKRVLLGSTLFMNVYPPLITVFTEEAFNLGSLVVHVAIPVIVYGIAEIIPIVMARTRQVIHKAYAAADANERQAASTTSAPADDDQPVPPAPADTAHPNRAEVAPPDPAESARSMPVETARPAQAAPAQKPVIRLPESTLTAIRRVRDERAEAGQPMTVADVQSVVKLPPHQARQVLDDVTATAGATA
ncbi:hypothetical protein HUO13_02365 [Saccharopolyspora erythraea]|uniref:hypothetical protein n=1 Tax=Saccharopolyspora erythraea TaxID=1836 RepID=UPI001BA5C58C|nr:hypothetical protein [Saccharopolyspora erythraea]QUG99796.1 hypothetical protein HUO13_02365 [Saccharopolyspora erythraea]